MLRTNACTSLMLHHTFSRREQTAFD